MNKQQLQSAAAWRTNKGLQDRIKELEGVLDRCHLWLTVESKSYEGSMLQDHVKALLSAAPERQ
jgi:hypothetical protein